MTLANFGVFAWGGGAWWGDGGFGWPWPGLIWLVFVVLFWGGLIALLIWAVRSTTAPRRHPYQPDMTRESAMDMLRRRLAEGEITPEEFERIKDLLRD